MQSKALLDEWRQRIDGFLAAQLPPASESPQRLHEAMRYAVLGDGKRLRPLLVYAAAHAVNGASAQQMAALDHAAAAVELIHAYSLVHDDLPAMDDDALRRGRPTVHVAFDEATAILVGDALQSEAFHLLAHAPAPAEARVAALAELARASGSRGMCGGQALDMAATGNNQTLAALAHMHRLKTGALIEASLMLGGHLVKADDAALRVLQRIGAELGLAFQIRDDLLDVEADSATLGKTAGKDEAQSKSTYVTLLGLEGARTRLAECAQALDAALKQLPGGTNENGQALSDLAAFAIQRSR
jgi:farnesyl diphosphate synthase